VSLNQYILYALARQAAELVQTGLKHRPVHPKANEVERRAAAQQWLEDWFRLGDEASANAPPGPSANQLLSEARNRLEKDRPNADDLYGAPHSQILIDLRQI
jgi:hypothetical protein